MNMLITTPDKGRLEEIRKTLSILGCKEGTFLKVELLFYEALTIAKGYGENVQFNKLLASLRDVQSGVYQATKEVCKTSSQKERLIRKFVVQFKKAISCKLPALG
jgi:hypothetical protein